MDAYTSQNKLYEINGRQYECPFELTVSVVASKWKLKIVKVLSSQQSFRYSALKRSISGNITHKMLIQSLKGLEADGLISRTMFSEVPPRVEYALTEDGIRLHQVIEAMNVFGSQYLVGAKE